MLNLGILAHVDAGKTTLTEQLLHHAGAITEAGRVDAGTTHTDTLALERRRGITIRAAVVAFRVGDLTVDLIDTPGHPDFIAEVERSLRVLDGAVLVMSAVEGVQAQTVVLMRALRRLRIPTLLFVNKIDRVGADPDRVLAAAADRLGVVPLVMTRARHPGTAAASVQLVAPDGSEVTDALAEALAGPDEAVLDAYLRGEWEPLAARVPGATADGRVCPAFMGSAIRGTGVPELIDGLRLLPPAGGDPGAPLSAGVFKVERAADGRRVTYVRLFDGTLRPRDRVGLAGGQRATVTSLEVMAHGGPTAAERAVAGQVAVVTGLDGVRVGERIGARGDAVDPGIARPTVETAVVARDPAQRSALHAALVDMSTQDPLTGLRYDEARQQLHLSLYGEVQKEVVADTLAADYGLDVDFRDTRVLCIERVASPGTSVIRLGDDGNPFVATVGLRIEPAPPGSGVELRIEVEHTTIPMYVFKTVEAFRESLTGYVVDALSRGPHGWPVPDALVTLVESDYNSPSTTAADVRKLTDVVVAEALRRAGTVVCAPVLHFRIDLPATALSAVLRLLSRHRATTAAPETSGRWIRLEGRFPTAELRPVQVDLPGATGGEGVIEAEPAGYAQMNS